MKDILWNAPILRLQEAGKNVRLTEQEKIQIANTMAILRRKVFRATRHAK